MASILDTIRSEVAKGFKGKLRTGTLRRIEPSSGVDSLGDPMPGIPRNYSFEGMLSNYTLHTRAVAQIPDGDVRILIIAGLLAVEPKQADQLNIEGKWFQVRDKTRDPATATWECQCYPIKDPT